MLARALVFGAAWMLFSGKLEPVEIACAIACGAAAAFADRLASDRVRASLPLDRDVLRQLVKLPRSAVAGAYRLFRVLVDGSFGSHLGTVPFDLSGPKHQSEGRCAMTVLRTNVGADILVLDIAGRGADGRLIFHRLDRRRVGLANMSRLHR